MSDVGRTHIIRPRTAITFGKMPEGEPKVDQYGRKIETQVILTGAFRVVHLDYELSNIQVGQHFSYGIPHEQLGLHGVITAVGHIVDFENNPITYIDVAVGDF